MHFKVRRVHCSGFYHLPDSSLVGLHQQTTLHFFALLRGQCKVFVQSAVSLSLPVRPLKPATPVQTLWLFVSGWESQWTPAPLLHYSFFWFVPFCSCTPHSLPTHPDPFPPHPHLTLAPGMASILMSAVGLGVHFTSAPLPQQQPLQQQHQQQQPAPFALPPPPPPLLPTASRPHSSSSSSSVRRAKRQHRRGSYLATSQNPPLHLHRHPPPAWGALHPPPIADFCFHMSRTNPALFGLSSHRDVHISVAALKHLLPPVDISVWPLHRSCPVKIGKMFQDRKFWNNKREVDSKSY